MFPIVKQIALLRLERRNCLEVISNLNIFIFDELGTNFDAMGMVQHSTIYFN